MSPLLRKSLILAILTHMAFIVFWGGSTYLSLNFNWGHNSDINEVIVDLTLVGNDFSIGEDTRIVSQGDNGAGAEPSENGEKSVAPEEDPQQMTRISENEAEQRIEENISDERAPTENVDDSGTNFTQTEQGNDLSQAIDDIAGENVVVEDSTQNTNDKPEEDPQEEQPQDEASALRFPIPVTDIPAPPNRPSDLKNIANREEASRQARANENQNEASGQGNSGAPGDNLDDILGNAMDGENQLKVRDAVIAQLGQRGCYNPPLAPEEKKYYIPVVITLSAAGQIINAEFESGYRPKDDYERAKADAALRATQHPACETINGIVGMVSEGKQLTIPFQ